MRVVALGHPFRGDDGAALEVARRLRPGLAEIVLAGRPGPGLLDLLDPAVPTVLVDVVRAGVAPGTLVEIPLEQVAEVRQSRASSHGLGPGDALALGRVLGRALPPGWLVGVEGERFEPGEQRSEAVEAAMDAWVAAVERRCTSGV